MITIEISTAARPLWRKITGEHSDGLQASLAAEFLGRECEARGFDGYRARLVDGDGRVLSTLTNGRWLQAAQPRNVCDWFLGGIR